MFMLTMGPESLTTMFDFTLLSVQYLSIFFIIVVIFSEWHVMFNVVVQPRKNTDKKKTCNTSDVDILWFGYVIFAALILFCKVVDMHKRCYRLRKGYTHEQVLLHNK